MSQTNTAPETTPQTTKQRLLEAAEEVFATKGYEGASVEEITRKAGANRAAISFHFGGKERLYIETVKYAHRLCHQGVPFPEWPAGTPAVERLRGFIRTMVTRMVAEPDPYATQVMMREMAKPTEACVEVVREYIRPIADILVGILDELLPPGTPHATHYLTGFSIIGQCLFYKQNRPVAALLMGPDEFTKLDADQIAEHITAFTLRALGVPS
jgi:TetR/AcrR family transcriptional regulator, regulator of cefoperazone and chloramphenicol sensitivity